MELLYSLLYILNEMSPYILLGFLIAGILHVFVSRQTMARHLSGTGWKSVIKSALLGIPLPLCSCGVLPTAIALKRNGASKAATTSFLVATPQTGVDSIAATWSLLGPAFAVIRPVAALATALFGGIAVGKAESKTPDHIHPGSAHSVVAGEEKTYHGFINKSIAALKYGYIDLVGSIGSWLVAGLVIAALITVYVPDEFFSFFGNNPLLSMLVVLIIAVPMYVCATGSIPIAMSLILKGLSPGTALVLLMAGPAANFASFTLISREMGRKAAAIYIGAIIIGAIAFGLAIDYIFPEEWFKLKSDMMISHSIHSFPLFSTICSAILVVFLLISFVKKFTPSNKLIGNMTKEYVIKGMNCPHCQATVLKSIKGVAGVEDAEVSLSTGKARVEGDHDSDVLIAAVRKAGFDVA